MSIHPIPQKWQPIPGEEVEKEVELIKLRTALERLTKEEVIDQFIEVVKKMQIK